VLKIIQQTNASNNMFM